MDVLRPDEDFGPNEEVGHAESVNRKLQSGLIAMLTLVSTLDPSATEEKEVVDKILGRPNVSPGGPSPMSFHPSIPKCDTKSFVDVFKFIPILAGYATMACCCMVIFGDGQTVETLRAAKRRWPHIYKPVLIGNGHFHSFAHFCFCLIYGYWCCCLCTFATWLHKEKQIYRSMNDLENDNAKHALDFHRVVTAAIMCYLLLDVKSPRPALLFSDPALYAARLRHGGGIVLWMYLLHAGFPVLNFQRAIRSGNGRGIQDCLCYAFHCYRSLAHKTKSEFITLTVLTGMVCAHPKLQEVLMNCCCVSLLGSNLMAYDRLIEYVNLLQKKRATAFKGFEKQLNFTRLLKALVHVDAAWKEADGGGTGLDDGIPAYLYNDVSELRRKLRETLGTDLEADHPGNSLWHTGNAVPLDGGDYWERMPWEYQDRVTFGRSLGVGRAGRPQSWRERVNDFIDGHLFSV